MSKMDSLFLIGDSHQICQDYALTGEITLAGEVIEYMIVSDGCSSSKNSDLGARILPLVARQNLQYLLCGEKDIIQCYYAFGSVVINDARALAKDLMVSDNCLDATLMITIKRDTEICTFVYGDGNYIVKDLEGNISVSNIKFESGAPFYLNYWNDMGRFYAYMKQYPGALDIGMPLGVMDKVGCPVDMPIVFCNSTKEVSMVVISTDGIESFATKDTNGVIALDRLVPDLFGFKNINGEFLKRRVERHVSELDKICIKHHDDLGIACLLIDREV